MRQEELNNKYRKFRLVSWVFLLGGVAAMISGCYRLLFMKASFGTNIKAQLPQVDNGTITIVLGVLFFCTGVYRLLKPATSFKSQIASEQEFRDQFKKKKDSSRVVVFKRLLPASVKEVL